MKTIFFALILILTCGLSFWKNRTALEEEYQKNMHKAKIAEQEFISQLKAQENTCQNTITQIRRQQENYTIRNQQLENELKLLQTERTTYRNEIAMLDEKISLMTRRTADTELQPISSPTIKIPAPQKTKSPFSNHIEKIEISAPAEPPFSVFPLSRKPVSEKKERLAIFFNLPKRLLLKKMEIKLSSDTNDYEIESPHSASLIQKNLIILPAPVPGTYRIFFSGTKGKKQKIIWNFTSIQGHRGSHEILL